MLKSLDESLVIKWGQLQPVGAFFDKRFVELPPWSAVNGGPALLAVVLQEYWYQSAFRYHLIFAIFGFLSNLFGG